jgi:membrane fusion protein (multidrug efflux system)
VIDAPMGKIVFVVTPDNKLAPRPVELDGWSHGEWIVTKGLKAGERVMVDGVIKAHDPGMTVKPVLISAQAANAAPAPTAPAACKEALLHLVQHLPLRLPVLSKCVDTH